MPRIETIKPAAGVVLLDHANGYAKIPEDGASVEWDMVWAKRVAQGDAAIVRAPDAAKPAASTVKPVPALAAPSEQ
jgi:hypothetical protein